MKKVYTLFAAAFFMLLFSVCAGAYALGDVNGDGKVEAADARLALRAAVGLEWYHSSTEAYYAANVDGLREIEASDARSILRCAVGLESLELITAEKTHVDLLPGGTAMIPVRVRNGFSVYAESENDALRIDTSHTQNGITILFVSGVSVCENAPVRVVVSEYPGEPELEITVTVKNDEGLFLNMVGMELIPDFGAMIGIAPEQTVSYWDFGHFELRYEPLLQPEDAESTFYSYAALLEQLGYSLTASDTFSDYRHTYEFYNAQTRVGVKYMEDFSSPFAGAIVESVWIEWYDVKTEE